MGEPKRNADVRRFFSVVRSTRSAAADGKKYGAELLALPPSAWRRRMSDDPRYRSFGVLEYLLTTAHEKLEKEPTSSRELTSAVLAFVDDVADLSETQTIELRGRARKEHANSLCWTDDLNGALAMIEEALALYETVGALEYQATVALLVKAQVQKERGEVDEAIALARRCAARFQRYRDSKYYVMARQTEAWILFATKQFRPAMAIWSELLDEATRKGDKSTRARTLHNIAECARELGDHTAARALYGRALPLFEELELVTEIPRVCWGYALSLIAQGGEREVRTGISELYKTRALYLSLGMIIAAALASLDIVRTRFQREEDVTELCSELVTTFQDAGATQNALEALAYLRERVRQGRATAATIEHIRQFFSELGNRPAAAFRLCSEES